MQLIVVQEASFGLVSFASNVCQSHLDSLHLYIYYEASAAFSFHTTHKMALNFSNLSYITSMSPTHTSLPYDPLV